jgi:hypothetical protein
MRLILLAAAVLSSAFATPDCYDFSVTTLNTEYFEVLPKLLFYGQTDWLNI